MKKTFQHMTVGSAVAAVLSTAALATFAPVAFSAENSAEGLEEVTVTGSRIVRRDAEANSPLITVESETLESRTGLNIESFLNQLPNFNPATTPVTSQGDVQITPVNSVGISSISLRGFGPNRNLVLVDGHRVVPINPLMVTDVSGIPSSLIERVEIISGGASATYGADAIGGVTNFIMKRNYEGLEVDLQSGIAEVGDAQENRAYGIFGTNFADNRGNVTMGVEYYKRSKGMERERDFYTDSWSDPTVGGDFFLFGYNGYAATAGSNAPNINTVNRIFDPRPVYTSGPGAGLATGVCNFNSCSGTDFRFNTNSSIFASSGNTQTIRIPAGGGRPIDGQEYAIQNVYDSTGTLFLTPGIVAQAVKWNNPDAMVLGPQERHSIFGSGRFDITDNLEFFARGTWAESKTRTLLLPTNASSGWEATIPFVAATDSPVDPTLDYTNTTVVGNVMAALASGNLGVYANPNFIPTGRRDPDGTGPLLGAQHPVTPELAMLLLSRPAAARTQGWMLQTFPLDSFDQRATLNTNTMWNIETGLRFDLPFGDWAGDLYYSHGESSTYNQAFGNNSLSRWRVMATQPDYGRGAALSSNTTATLPAGQAAPARPGFGGGDVTCTSGFYDMIFKADTRPSDDCRTAVMANLQSRLANQQDVAELNFQGGLFSLPAGQIRAAFGLQYRENASQFTPDILQSTSSFLDQVIGVYPTGYLDASANVMDYYGELLVPVISDLPFLKKVELELGGRYSDYEWTDSEFTYKALASFQFTDWLRLRGGYNRATRAPNLGELFLNTQEIFTVGGANFSDSCSGRSTAPFGAGGVAPDPILTTGEPPTQLASGQTVAGATSTYLICQAQMGQIGRDFFYGGPGGVPPGTNAVGGTGGLFNWVLQQGNPELTSEVADTWSVGMVLTSPWTQPWISGFQMTLDWWKVDISEAIQQYSMDYARYLCYGTNIVSTAAAATAQANSPECRNVSRDPNNGQPLTTMLEYANLATISVSGLDLSLNWRANFGDLGLDSVPGSLNFNVMASFYDYYKTKASPLPFDIEIDWAGSLGPTLSGTNPGAYDWRMNAGIGYSYDSFSVNLRWRYLPSVLPAGLAQQQAIIDHNAAVAASGSGSYLSYTPSPALAVDSYSAFDLSFNWDINSVFSIRGGIDNLFDTEPNITTATAGRPYDPNLTLAQNQAVLAAVCSAEALTRGCVNPTAFSLASTGAGSTSAGFYDTIGRRYFLGVKMRF